jgi:ribosomal protein L37AE/L43A
MRTWPDIDYLKCETCGGRTTHQPTKGGRVWECKRCKTKREKP